MRSAACFRAAIALFAAMALFGAGPGGAADGSWLIEGHGVVPDVEVENPPHASFLGKDLQLEAALEHLTRKLHESPLPVPQPQAIPPVGEGAPPSKLGERP